MSETYAAIAGIPTLSLVTIALLATVVVFLIRTIRHARLQTANFGSHQALNARRDLIAIVVRDLQYPINSVALSSSVLAKTLETSQPDIGFVVQNLKGINRSAFRMNRLIEDLITSIDIEAGELRIQPQACDIRVLLREFEQGVLPLLGESSIEFVSSIGRGIPNAFVDPDRLMQILSNVIRNAINHTRPHSVVLVSVQTVDGNIQFRVKDSRTGFPESEIPRILDHAQERDKKDGGLGLYISKALVEAHGGRIWTESVVGGGGTSVYFTVPQAEALPQRTAGNRTF